MDWGAWSQEAVSLMTARMRELLARHEVPTGAAYRWDLDAGVMTIGDAQFRLVTIGTVAADNSFLWAWGNDSLPASATVGLEQVRSFGVEHELPLLSEPYVHGGLAQAKECLALAGRVLDADGVWINKTDAGFILFLLFESTRH
jgi:hypothetical protein